MSLHINRIRHHLTEAFKQIQVVDVNQLLLEEQKAILSNCEMVDKSLILTGVFKLESVKKQVKPIQEKKFSPEWVPSKVTIEQLFGIETNVKEALIELPSFIREKPIREPRIKKEQVPYLGIRATDLPPELTRDEFDLYLKAKQEESPRNKFWKDAVEIEKWLLSKGIKVCRP
jgi:hypothetical protein